MSSVPINPTCCGPTFSDTSACKNLWRCIIKQSMRCGDRLRTKLTPCLLMCKDEQAVQMGWTRHVSLNSTLHVIDSVVQVYLAQWENSVRDSLDMTFRLVSQGHFRYVYVSTGHKNTSTSATGYDIDQMNYSSNPDGRSTVDVMNDPGNARLLRKDIAEVQMSTNLCMAHVCRNVFTLFPPQTLTARYISKKNFVVFMNKTPRGYFSVTLRTMGNAFRPDKHLTLTFSFADSFLRKHHFVAYPEAPIFNIGL